MKVKVIREKCAGCGACVALCPNYFMLDSEGLSKVKKESVDKKDEKLVLEAKDACPAGAIETY